MVEVGVLILDAGRTVWNLLPPDRRGRVVALWALLSLAALGDLAAIASWYPFTKSILEPASITTTPWLAMVYDGLGFQTLRAFQVFLGTLVAVVLVLGSGLRILADWRTTRLGWDEKGRLAELLLTRLVSLPHAELRAKNSTEMTRDVLMNVVLVVDGFMLSLARTYTACVFTAGTVGTFLVVHPGIALASALATGLIYMIVYAGVQTRIHDIAQAGHGEAYHVVRTSTEALCLIKEARCPPHRVEMSAAFRNHLEGLNKLLCQFTLLEKVPAPVALATAQIGILLLCALLVTTGAEESRALVAVFAVALARLIPEVRAIYAGLIQLRRAKPIADGMSGMLAHREAPEEDPCEAAGVAPRLRRELRLEGVWYRYDEAGPDVLEDVDLVLPARGTLALVGQTGCGKTTLADLMAGVLVPTQGQVTIDGEELTPARASAWRAGIGYVPQDVYMTEDSVRKNIAFGVDEDQIDDIRVRQAATEARIHEFVEGLSEGYDTVVGERGLAISGGQRQRVGIARALYRDPDLLIFDEATSALDTVTEASIMDALQGVSEGRTVVIIAHRLSSIRDCEQIYMLEAGRVLAKGTYASLLETCEPFQDLIAATRAVDAAAAAEPELEVAP